jgi:hypothetical protein
MPLKVLPAVVLTALTVGASPAVAAGPAPNLTIHTMAAPTHFSSADTEECNRVGSTLSLPPCDSYQVTVTNSGGASTKGPVTLTDTLPAGLTVLEFGGTPEVRFTLAKNAVSLQAAEGPAGFPVGSCKPEVVVVSCEYAGALAPDQRLEMVIYVTVKPGAASAPNMASVSEGGGGPVTSTTQNDVISSTPPPFGASAFISPITSSDGTPDTQAGDHPYEFVTRIDLNTKMGLTPESTLLATTVGGGVRDVAVDLPLGFLGSATSTPKCQVSQLVTFPASCPLSTLVGQISVEPEGQQDDFTRPVFNLVPEHGVAAEFAFTDALFNSHVIESSVVPSGSGYVLRATAREVPDINLGHVITTFYGDPAAKQAEVASLEGQQPTGIAPAALFTNSSDCSGEPLSTTVHMDSWEHPGTFNADGTPAVEDPSGGWASMTTKAPPVTGCDLLRFAPEAFTAKPETSTADTPTGLNLDLKIPQNENPHALATPPLRNATVTLPAGLALDPSAASGLAACSEAQIGWLGPVSSTNPGLTNFTATAPTCPDASKIGDLTLTTPLVDGTLHGSIYLAKQSENPFGSLLAGYIVVDDEATGTIVKIPGELKTNPQTGQITGIFKENPQLPFSDLKLHFFGGPRGDLATPDACGTYTTTSDLMPWSAPESGPDATPSDSFEINNGCVSGFTPAFHAGTTSPQAGAFSPFTLSLGREDNEQGLGGLTVNLPTGLVGKIAGVGQCTEAQVAAAQARSAPGQGAAELASPSCPESSLLGTVTTATGPGPTPFSVTGKAYLTGPYKGAPYGLAVIVPAIAGPFDLGVVVIRQALYINPTDAHVTDVSDPFPTIRDGIPLRIKRVSVNLNRPNFTLNPTSCEVKAITATATSIQGAQAPLSAHYQAAGCQGLPFHPEFSASTLGHTSKQNGASLHVRIGFHPGQANIHKVELTIPNILPSRLTTLQKACPEAQFNTNPAGCPSASLIATAIAHTPLLPDPLSGPVYFVSHGGAAFPDTVMVLQGDNVKLQVVGHTDIKKGVTYSRFETVPDAPVTSFEFNAPEGPYSIFGSNGNLCQTEVRMPTTITAQNGAVLTQSTLVEPEGCSNTLTILSHRAKKRTITLKVVVPSAGKLTASGKGLTSGSKTAGARSTVTITLNAKRHGKLNTKVKLTFTPTKGRKLTAAVAARFKH